MIEEVATVVTVKDDTVTVVCEVKSTCSSCEQVENCGSGQVAKAFPQKQLSVALATDKPLNVGDKVIIGLSEKCLIQAAWQVYLMPLMGLIIFSAVGQFLLTQQILMHELLAIALGAFGGYLGYLSAKALQNRQHIREKMTPKLIRVLKSTLSVTQINS